MPTRRPPDVVVGGGTPRADLVRRARELHALVTANPGAHAVEVEQLVQQARRSRDVEALGHGLRAAATVHRLHLRHADALRLLDEAVRLGRRHGLVDVEVWARASRATTRLETGRAPAARADVAAARALLTRTHGRSATEPARAEAYLLSLVAILHHHAGRLHDAEEAYRQVAVHGGASDDLASRAMNNLAFLLAQRGSAAEALGWADQACERSAHAGDALHGQVVQTRAWVAARAGHLQRSLRDFDEAAEICARAGLPLGEHYSEYADAMRELRLFAEASAAAARAVEAFAAAGASLMEVEARVRLAETLLLSSDLRGAEQAAAAARDVAERQRRPEWRLRAEMVLVGVRAARDRPDAADAARARRAARGLERAGAVDVAAEAHLVAGRLSLGAGDVRGALASLAAVGPLAAAGSVLARVRARVAAALAASARGERDDVMQHCRAGLRDLARHRANLPTMELRALASGHGAELGELGLGVLVESGSPVAVMRWMERTRATALLARLPVEEPGPRVPRASAVLGDALPGATRRPTVVSDDEDVERMRRTAWKSDVSSAGSGAHAVPGVGRIRDALGSRVLVEYGQHDGRYVAVVLGRRAARVVDLCRVDEVGAHLRALVFGLRRLADPRGPAAAEAARVSAEQRLTALRAALVEPLGLPADCELVVAPVGALHGVPWSALHDGPVALAPSATAWVRTASAERKTTPSTVLVAGPGLVGAHDEVEALRAVHPSAQVIGARDSSAERVVDAVAGADLAHLACHGVLRSDNPMFSAVVLADGPLTVQELHRAGVAPRRLVLASCHSGADVSYAGNELLGLVAAMLSRGTAGVVASIAAVPDVEVVDLMLGLHRRLAAGETMARALHGARGEIDRSTPAGFVNWCTFSAHGAG